MNVIEIRRKLLKTQGGRFILSSYHYLVAIPLTYWYRLKYKLSKYKKKNITFFPDVVVLEGLEKDKKSLCRFGDGEIGWIYRDSNGYFGQENSELLSNRLREVLLSDNPNIFIGVPNFFGEMKEYDKRRRHSRDVHLAKYGRRWMNLLSEDRKYADSLISRVYLGRNCDHMSLFNLWRKVWNGRKVIIIEGEETKFGVGNDLLNNAGNIKRILVPAENAFAIYPKILNTVKELGIKDAVYLLAIGPTATVLAYDMAKMGYQAIDIGHLDIEYEWFLRKAKAKIAVPGKYVNESNGHKANQEIIDCQTNYQLQIIANCNGKD